MDIRIQPRDIDVPKDNPFKNDLLDRQEAVEVLTDLVGNIEGPCVMAIWVSLSVAMCGCPKDQRSTDRFRPKIHINETRPPIVSNDWYDEICNCGALFVQSSVMETVKIGFARCSTLSQDLEAQQKTLRELSVHENRNYTDHGLTGTNRERPSLDQALAALREGDTLVVSKLDRLAGFVPDARTIADELQKKRHETRSRCDSPRSHGPDGEDVLQHLCHLRRVRSGPHQDVHPRGHGDRKGEGKVAGETAKTAGKTTERALANARYRGIFDQRSCRGLLRITADCLSNVDQAENCSTYASAPGLNYLSSRKNVTGRSPTNPLVLKPDPRDTHFLKPGLTLLS